MKIKFIAPVFFFLFISAQEVFAFQNAPIAEGDTTSAQIDHNSDGFVYTTADKKHQLQLSGRLQFRFVTPYGENPITYDDFGAETRNIFKINRARLKVGGYSYQPWLKYYFEYDLTGTRLLDFRIMVEKWPWLNFKLGQWKAEYSRERSISSGGQQMMDRSIINRPFTLDRQQGISVYGHLHGPGLADFDYHLSVLSGNGRGANNNDDENLLYIGKIQWNFLGEGAPISGSALEFFKEPVASLAWAGATNTSQFTRFSSQGGGSLVGFTEGIPGQYTINQYLFESALKYRSFSWHSEFHNKHIRDNFNGTETTMLGWFGQGGIILNRHLMDDGHPLLEIAARYAYFRPDSDLAMNHKNEFSLALNCFFKGHLNKLTADVTRFNLEEGNINREASGWLFRLQYDFSF